MNVAALVQLQRPVFPSSFPFLRSFEENHVCSLASGGKEILQLCPGVASKKGTREASLEVQKLQLFPLNLDIMMVHLNHQVPATIHCVFQSLFNRVTISEKQCLYVIKDSKVDLSFYNTSLYNVSCRTRWNCSLMKKKKIVEDEFSLGRWTASGLCDVSYRTQWELHPSFCLVTWNQINNL